jgi:hypothetical protein
MSHTDNECRMAPNPVARKPRLLPLRAWNEIRFTF